DYTFAVQRWEGAEEALYLFDNRSDPYQLRNIAASRSDIVNELQGKLAKWLTQTDDPWIAEGAGQSG
ncbi:hypothetical protein HN588_00970, partial [Candidatus Bathyarchaeota archaeon]|nr:hypothetical protein [Candidatus Bathyarchaeota archaeon]